MSGVTWRPFLKPLLNRSQPAGSAGMCGGESLQTLVVGPLLSSLVMPAVSRLRRALVAPCTTTVRGLPSEVLL